MAEVTGVICTILTELPLTGDGGEQGTVNMFFIVFVGDANVSKARCKRRK